MRQAFPGKPRGRPCPNCGQEFLLSSLSVHMKSCVPARAPVKTTTVPVVQPGRTKIRAAMTADIPERAEGTAAMKRCRHCRRSFYEERVRKHEGVCLAGKPKKTRVFSSAKQRIGRDAPRPQKRFYHREEKPKGKWRQEHQEFISSIRYARKVTNAQAAGIDIRTIPAPAVSSHTNDYVQCPFCDRRFAQNVAERHIPKCKDIVNKPKPPPARPPPLPTTHQLSQRSMRPPATQLLPQRAPVASHSSSYSSGPTVNKGRSGSLGKPADRTSTSTCRGCGKPETRDHSCAYTKGLMRLLGSRS